MPRRVGDYEIVGELGRGGMAVVHLGRNAAGDSVAIKELSGFHDGDDAAAQRFLREAIVGSSLSHPNIVAVRDRLEEGGHPFILMEWVDGGTLRPFVGELSLAQLGGVFEGVLSALAHAGRMGVVHRDLKPENIMLTTDGVPKIADFGIAKATNATESSEGRLTRTGTAVGTPGYMAPEQAMASDISSATDLYAAGCIAFEALTGRLPFAGQAPMVMLMSHANADVPDIRDIDPLVSAPVAEWVAKMTARDPDDRFEDGDEAWAALEAALVETVGPDWREHSEIKPEPAEYTTVAQSGPATGAFATFAAPVALHEALAGELSERVTFGGSPLERGALPASPRLSRDQLEQAVRDQSPQTYSSLPAQSSEPVLAVPRSRRGRILAVAGAGVVVIAIVVGVLVATSSNSSAKLPDGMALTGAGVTVHAPAGWKTQTAAPVDGVKLAAAAGLSGADSAGLASVPQPTFASLAGGTAVSSAPIGSLRAAEVRSGDTELLLLTRASGGTATLVCRGSQAMSQCSAIAQTAAASLAPAVSSGDQQSAQGGLSGQSAQLSAANRALNSAGSGNAQASAATQIASVLANEGSALANAQLGQGATAAADIVEDATQRLARAWSGYGSAISDGGDTTGARLAVQHAQTDERVALEEAAALGLSLAGVLPSTVAPPAAKAFHHAQSPSTANSGSGSSTSSGNSTSSGGSSSGGSSGSGSSTPNTPTSPAKSSTPTKAPAQQVPGGGSGGPVLPGQHGSSSQTGGS